MNVTAQFGLRLRAVASVLGMLASALALAVTCLAQTAVTAAPVLTLEQLEQRALERNPTLAQAQAVIDAAKGRARQAGLFPNPTIGYTGDEISRGPIIRGGEHGLFVAQTFPLGGKLRLSRDIYEREVAEAEAVANQQRRRVVNTVRLLYYAALAAERRVQVRENLARLSAEAVGVSRQLLNTGAADRPDVLESEIEAQRAQLALNTAKNARFRLWKQMGAVTGDPDLAPTEISGSLDDAIPELVRDPLLVDLLHDSPEVAAARAAQDRAEAAPARARGEPVPDLTVRAGPRYNRELLELNARPVGWELAAEAGFTIPLFNRNQGAIAAGIADLSRAKQEVSRLDLELRARFASAFDDYLTSLRMAESYRLDLIPRAEESYRLYLTRYQGMAAAYPQVLIAQRTLFQVSDAYVDAAESAWMAVVQLQGLLLGGGLDMPAVPGGAGSADRMMMSTGSMNPNRPR